MLAEHHREAYLTAEQTQALVRALDMEANQDAAGALALLIVTGARCREVLLAKWEHVDMVHGALTVPRVAGHPFVFPSARRPGRPLEGLRGAWARAKRAAGLAAGQRIHDLRHSFASALANAGVPLFEIGTVLGHRQLSTTTRYAHHSPQRLVATADTAARAWNLLPAADAVVVADAVGSGG